MARYKPVDRQLSKLLAVRSEQILPGSFEYAVNWLVDYVIDMNVFDARYRNGCVACWVLPVKLESASVRVAQSPAQSGLCIVSGS